MRTDVELPLRQSRIHVEAGHAHLYVNVTVLKRDNQYAVLVSVEFQQPVTLTRDPNIKMLATTWSQPDSFGVVPAPQVPIVIRDKVRDKVDAFINAYLAVNPNP